MNLKQTLFGSEKGASFIFVTVAIVLLFAFAVLAIDIGMLYVTKTQLQNAADASVLAGALGLVKSLGDSTTAVDWAIQTSGQNSAFVGSGDGAANIMGSVVISENDIEFPASNQVRVTTHRTEDGGDPLYTIFLEVIDPSSDGLTGTTATATASFAYVCGSSCLRPWVPVDRWYDADGDDTFNPDSITNPDEFYDPELTGYKSPDDVGLQVTLMMSNPSQTEFGNGWCYAVNFPPINKGTPITGANQYRDWIQGCVDASMVIEPGDSIQIEPGAMVGPTKQGVSALIALDPTAVWSVADNEVINSNPIYTISPRVIKACLFDPSIGLISQGGGRRVIVVVKVIAFFLEQITPQGNIVGRFMNATDSGGVECDDPEDPSFLYKVSLVE